MLRCLPILVVLLASSALIILNGQDLGDQGPPVCEGIGIYRPFTLARKFKLATAYFVNPSLPDRVRILNAYSLKEAIQWQGDQKVVAQRIESEEMALALPVNRDRAWTPPSWSHMNHCPPLISEVFGEAPMAFTRVSAPAEVEGLHGLAVWLGDLSSEDVYVLSEDDFDSGADNRVITWDPNESVIVGRPALHRRPW